MGRLSSITYPADPVGWHNTTIVFEPINSPTGEFGLPNKTWKRTVSTGDATGQAVSDTYYDALWRPLLTREYDSADPTSLRVTRRAFDARGRERYVSFPTRDALPYGTSQSGTRHWYDGIGRMLLTRTDSEFEHDLLRSYAYNDDFETVVTNELGHSTTFSYQAYDSPSTDWPISIDAPGNSAGRILTTIERDVYGKPKSVARGSLIRRWVYDNHQRLCRRYDPEAGWSVQHYGTTVGDNNGLIDWTATGLNILSNTGCVYPLSERTHYDYDDRNRPILIDHPTGTADLDFDYEPDGQLQAVSVIDNGQVLNRWDYSYNNRRLLESETLTVAGRSYLIDPTYDKFGSLSSLKYPDGTVLSYNPNRLGQPRTVGALATGVQYQPSGAVASFAYGNGVSYNATPNVRQLPLATQISHGILNETYAWDDVGNLTDISDNRSPQLSPSRTRNFLYDEANRLTYADYEDPALGPYGYVYDIHDNIERATRPASLGGNRTYVYNAFNHRLTRLKNDSGKTQIAYDYDAQGNAKLRDASGLGLTAYAYHYDRANRLLEVRHPTNEADVKARYQYDGHARRVLIEEEGEQRVQVYSQAGQYLFEEPDLISDASFTTGEGEQGKPSTRYQYLGNMLIARSSGTQTTYLHTDHLGSPIAESSVGPTVEVTHLPLHEPYGAPSNGTYLDGPGYTGHVVDGLTGLSYMQARYYDPVAGRFLGVDPVHVDLGSGGNFNRYWYGNDNPYKFVDPDGRFVVVLPFIGKCAVGCVAAVSTGVLAAGKIVSDALQGAVESAQTDAYDAGFYGEMINESAEITTDGSAEPSGRSNDDKLDDLIAGGKVEGESSTKKIGREGDEALRDKEFDDIGLNDVKDKGKVKVGTTDSGRRVVARPSTEDGRPTIEVQRPDGKPTVKIRYGSSAN
jgi:RHS repeat-associated protein